MACKMYVLLVAAVVAAAALPCTVAVTNHTISWIIPTNDATYYSSWASGKAFRVGDNINFTFTANAHDVLRVNEAAYNACTGTNGIGSVQTTPPVIVNLNTTGRYYFICTFGTHCTQGQKLSVNVLAASAAPTPAPSTGAPPPSTTPSTPPTTPSTPAPPTSTPTTPSSSSSGVFASVIVSVSAVVLGFCV